MKKLILFLLTSVLTSNLNAESFETLKVGQRSGHSGTYVDLGYAISGNAIAVSSLSYGNQYTYSVNIVAIAPGYGSISIPNSGNYAYHVLDVIPNDVNLIVGGSYTYSPVVDSSNYDYKTFTWTSNNTAVATVDANGKISAVAPGRATITCTANGGNSFSSVVYVSTQQIQEVKLNKKSQTLDAGKTAQLTATVSPDNATNKSVRWLSTNDNIAQVDDSGKVTAIGSGYCSIIAVADDGSGKFAKCLVHVNGTAGVRGDMNGDGQVTVTDASAVIDIILDK